MQSLAMVEQDVRATLASVREIVRKMADLPGLSELARWTMPIFLVDARWGCRACCGKLSRLGLR
jgi:hypothetical protein